MKTTIEKKTLHLVLMHKYFEMIKSGEKKEEYREMTPYWCLRLSNKNCIPTQQGICEFCKNPAPEKRNTCNALMSMPYDEIVFYDGYTDITITRNIAYFRVGIGNPAWGAPNHETFIFGLSN